MEDIKCKVLFTDGFDVSPVIHLGYYKGLREDMAKAMKAGSAERAFLKFAVTVGNKPGAYAHNAPEGRTFGGTLATIQAPGYWPQDDTAVAGVFLVNVNENSVSYWGGMGFHDSPEFTPAIPQVEVLVDLNEVGDEAWGK